MGPVAARHAVTFVTEALLARQFGMTRTWSSLNGVRPQRLERPWRPPTATFAGVEDEAWVELDQDVGTLLPAEFVDRYQFRLGTESTDWPAIVERAAEDGWLAFRLPRVGCGCG